MATGTNFQQLGHNHNAFFTYMSLVEVNQAILAWSF